MDEIDEARIRKFAAEKGHNPEQILAQWHFDKLIGPVFEKIPAEIQVEILLLGLVRSLLAAPADKANKLCVSCKITLAKLPFGKTN